MSDNITLPRKHIDYAAHALEHFNKDAPDPLVSEIIHHLRTALAAEPTKQEPSDDRKAMKLALEALEWAWGGEPMGTKEQAAMQALRTHLAAPRPEPEPVNVGLLEYRGNSVAYIYEKTIAYKHVIREVWAALESNGIYPDGKTRLAEVIAKHTAPPAPAPEPVPGLMELAQQMKPLDADMAAILHANLDSLYITDEPAAAPEKRHPGYVIGNHWLETAYSRVCAGEAEADVLRDCGWQREEAFLTGVAHLKAENDALRREDKT